jgi:hypothetical protein
MSTLITYHLLKLQGTTREEFLQRLKAATAVIQASRPRFFIRRPNTLDAELLNADWDLAIFLPGQTAIPDDLREYIETSYRTTWKVPEASLSNLATLDAELKTAPKTELAYFDPQAKEGVEGEKRDELGRSISLLEDARKLLEEHSGPVTMVAMLNLHEGGTQDYATYHDARPSLWRYAPDANDVPGVQPARQAPWRDGQNSSSCGCRGRRRLERPTRRRAKRILERGRMHLL